MRTPPGAAGHRGEQWALAYLTQRGLDLVARNYRCPQGEIDLIMRHRGELVFIEVRQRRRSDFGGAAASIDRGKRRRISACAKRYLQEHPECTGGCRFDVVAIDGEGLDARVTWIRSAFDS